jgi:hypothetical protein
LGTNTVSTLVRTASLQFAAFGDSANPHNEQTPLTMTLEHPGHSGRDGTFSCNVNTSTGVITAALARAFNRCPQFLHRLAPRITSPPHSGHLGRWSGAMAITSQPNGPSSNPQSAPANARPFAAPIIPPTIAAANQQRTKTSKEAAITIESLTSLSPTTSLSIRRIHHPGGVFKA